MCLKRTSENSELGKTQISFLGWRGALVGVAGCGGHARWVTQGGLCEVGNTRWIT